MKIKVVVSLLTDKVSMKFQQHLIDFGSASKLEMHVFSTFREDINEIPTTFTYVFGLRLSIWTIRILWDQAG